MMIERFPRLATALLAVSLAGVPALASDADAEGEAELAKILEGRVAGEPVDCIRDGPSDSLEIVDHIALVFKRGDTIYVNRPAGAQLLDYWDLPVVYRFASRLCRLDRVELRDRHSHIPGPNLFLDQFVPYTRPDR
ncbi:hypothetical protein A6F68_00705 [Tsuneonella dongtanensis]|uniref:Uncharacterized protein n=1 Tax=Tsuneonella dongtanensis TaxID=692370 RepID=A0A1B2AAV5_9SPHN|nr:hypothetical protein [Tsuneonella dongtanensis]ANY19234.1 hypothetical protein A6F68_00705 [Tsuneonella dongtanensis]